MKRLPLFALCFFTVSCSTLTLGKTIHVSTKGSLEGTGESGAPFLEISQAASIALPGDTVIIHQGTYREWVKPRHSGLDDENRITYRAAPGESVTIKGSEVASDWTLAPEVGPEVWKFEVTDASFEGSNPFKTPIFSGGTDPFADNDQSGWITYGAWHSRGMIYLDGTAFTEVQSRAEVASNSLRWHSEDTATGSVVYANFGEIDPADHLIEYNARESIFMPAVAGVDYITVEGLELRQAASGWAPPTMVFQSGAIGPRGGRSWIIENCRISDSRCVGVILGMATNIDMNSTRIEDFGHHIVRNNVIRRCGQAGIAGERGVSRSLIEGNLIDGVNTLREFGGWETAGIKHHLAIDYTLSNNTIRDVQNLHSAAYGIWIDFANQGVRITRNIIYDTAEFSLYLEHNHGPILIDHNIIQGKAIKSGSEGVIIAHNLFVDGLFDIGIAYAGDNRRSAYYTPHTLNQVGTRLGLPSSTRWYNNLFIGNGLDSVTQHSGDASNYNVFYHGASPSPWADSNSATSNFDPSFQINETDWNVEVHYNLDTNALIENMPLVDYEMIGILSPSNQSIEDQLGNGITVDRDLRGDHFDTPNAGPLSRTNIGPQQVKRVYGGPESKLGHSFFKFERAGPHMFALSWEQNRELQLGSDYQLQLSENLQLWRAPFESELTELSSEVADDPNRLAHQLSLSPETQSLFLRFAVR
ncbi:right-handed parallel beta-helix repeat-containing protein [Pelagicoccus mobilis]|uniref:Right-handed parallel beta-helix repeat-containing protein n=1 Tax=Pelagicoccus mobilis TaxID=415221 RepID=A0A934RWV8_9BACT|nr:right-handed parallel beta-helix repeat-containing protein [Pelagicoccus mobilis]MBK1876256.1 right-handed parallel beta-helix repeat-containing protein [Pelagicoccus mobilis]